MYLDQCSPIQSGHSRLYPIWIARARTLAHGEAREQPRLWCYNNGLRTSTVYHLPSQRPTNNCQSRNIKLHEGQHFQAH